MTTTLSTPRSTRGDELVAVDHPAGRKAWALAGLLSGIGAFIFFIGPASMLNPSTDSYADNADVLAELDGKAPWVWAFQTSGVALSILLVIFAVGLRRRGDRALAGEAHPGAPRREHPGGIGPRPGGDVHVRPAGRRSIEALPRSYALTILSRPDVMAAQALRQSTTSGACFTIQG